MGNSHRYVPLAIAGLLGISGCGMASQPPTQAQPETRAEAKPVTIDLAIAALEAPEPAREYTGTTAPLRVVSLRSRVEGRLMALHVDVGDRVGAGQELARLDDLVLTAAVREAEAELAAREAEVSRLEAEADSARMLVEEARLRSQQLQTDANRLDTLASAGASPTQEAERARTNARTAVQLLRSAEARAESLQRSIRGARRRVVAQAAVLKQARERQSYAVLRSPIDGLVLSKIADAGNLLQPGNEVLRLGDFRQVKVTVDVSELELSGLRVGQAAQIRLDALGDRPLTGTVSRISPAVNPQTRLVPVEVTLRGSDRAIPSGLLARVQFASGAPPVVTVPASALQRDRGNKNQAIAFVVQGSGKQLTVAPRPLTLGEVRSDGRAIVVAGLQPGDRYVVRSARKLKPGDRVVPSTFSSGASAP